MFTVIFIIILMVSVKKGHNESANPPQNDCVTLQNMSKLLNKMIKNPQRENANNLLHDIEKFNDLIWEIREAIRDGNTTVMEDIKPIVNVTLPSFVQTYETLQRKINKDKRKLLYQAFNWTEKVRKRFEFLCVDAKFHWETLQTIYDLKTRKIV